MTTSIITRSPQSARETVATFGSYPDAQALVDRLADADFPVQDVQITGAGLRSVEYVTGRLTSAGAAAQGALSGLWFGLLLTLLAALFIDSTGAGLLFTAPLLAAAWGAAFGYIGHRSLLGRRDFASISGFEAEQFVVTVSAQNIDEARRLA